MIDPTDIYSGLSVIALIGCNLAAIPLWRHTSERTWTTSFAAGAAAAYLFLVLLPEIEIGHETLGEKIHLVTLGGFVLFYLLHSHILTLDTSNPGRLRFELSLAAVYQFLLVFTMHENLPLGLGLTGVYVLGIGLHLVQQRHSLAEAVPTSRTLLTTTVLSGALILAWFTGYLTQFPVEVLNPNYG